LSSYLSTECNYQGNVVKWEDGSMQADLPMNRLSELFNVNHMLVSQVRRINERPFEIAINCVS